MSPAVKTVWCFLLLEVQFTRALYAANIRLNRLCHRMRRFAVMAIDRTVSPTALFSSDRSDGAIWNLVCALQCLAAMKNSVATSKSDLAVAVRLDWSPTGWDNGLPSSFVCIGIASGLRVTIATKRCDNSSCTPIIDGDDFNSTL